jgi:hypothetical protein
LPDLIVCSSLIGPVIGGYLADPVKTLPSIFHDRSVWQHYPYLLPNLIVALFIASSGLLGFFFLEETHPELRNNRNIGLEISKWICGKVKAHLGHMCARGYTALSAGWNAILLLGRGNVEEANELDEEPDEVELSSLTASIPTDTPKPSAYSPQIILQILAVSILAFHKVSSDVIIPMFLVTKTAPSEDFSDKSKRNFFKFGVGFNMASLRDLFSQYASRTERG